MENRAVEGLEAPKSIRRHLSDHGIKKLKGPEAAALHRELQVAPTPKTEIDILVVWTLEAECHLFDVCPDEPAEPNRQLEIKKKLTPGSKEAMESYINKAVRDANVAFSNSGIDAKLNVVHMYRDEEYLERNGIFTALDDITCTNDDIATDPTNCRQALPDTFDDVHEKRQEFGADMVMLIIKGDEGANPRLSGSNGWIGFDEEEVEDSKESKLMFSVSEVQRDKTPDSDLFLFASGMGLNFVSANLRLNVHVLVLYVIVIFYHDYLPVLYIHMYYLLLLTIPHTTTLYNYTGMQL